MIAYIRVSIRFALLFSVLLMYSSVRAGGYIYIIYSDFSSTVTVIDRDTNEKIKDISLHGAISALCTGAKKVYTFESEYCFINTICPQKQERICFFRGPGSEPTKACYAQGLLYVLSRSYGVFVIDPVKEEKIKLIRTGQGPFDFCHAKGKIYVTCPSSNSISVIDPEFQNTLEHDIPLNTEPHAICYYGEKLYVTSVRSKVVSVIDCETLSEKVLGYLDKSPSALIAAQDHLFVGKYDSNSISIFNLISGKKIGEITVGKEPIAFCHVGEKIYVANRYSRSISIIDPIKLTKIGDDIELDGKPKAMIYFDFDQKFSCKTLLRLCLDVIDNDRRGKNTHFTDKILSKLPLELKSKVWSPPETLPWTTLIYHLRGSEETDSLLVSRENDKKVYFVMTQGIYDALKDEFNDPDDIAHECRIADADVFLDRHFLIISGNKIVLGDFHLPDMEKDPEDIDVTEDADLVKIVMGYSKKVQ